MDYHFHKQKIPKELSYPMKRNVLDKILEDTGTNRIKSVTYSANRRENIIVLANFVGEAHKIDSAGNIGLSVYPVSSDERKQTEKLLIEQGFPKFVEWLKKIESLGEGWRLKTRLFEIKCGKGRLSFSETV